jgi:type III pantothenate kinase
MKLFVDIGNSCAKWQFEQDNIQQVCAYQSENFNANLTAVWQNLPRPTEIWVANVAGVAIAEQLSAWTQEYWQLTPQFVRSRAYAAGVYNGYIQPEILGVDRWLAIIAAYQQDGAVCVIDCGTAVTVDIVDAQGQHQGGMISAGLETTRKALLKATYALGKIPPQTDLKTAPLAATETHQGIMLGSLYALVGLIETVFQRVQVQHPSCKLVLTGGSVPEIESLLSVPYQYQPNLVLQGLTIISGE